jgi:TIR domain
MNTSERRILGLVRKSLDKGVAVEIDGLGTFHRGSEGYHFTPQTQPQVFLAYVEEDLALARRVCDALRKAGCSPWMDKEKLLPGQNWPRSIERAIEISDAFVACFSHRSVAKRSQFQNELRWAMDCARRIPLDETFLIPVRLEVCPVPKRISDQVQYVDLFPDWDKGIRRLIRSVKRTVKTRKPARLF